MRKLNAEGSLVLPFVIVIVLLVGSLSFGIWAFMGRQDYKNNSDKKAADAAAVAVKAEDVKKDAAFAEEQKSPLKTYTGPSTYGSVTFQYAKTWSAYVAESSANSGALVDGYFSPNFVPSILSANAFALRIQIINSDYTTTLKAYGNSIQQNTVKAAAFRAQKVPSVLGSTLSGQITSKKQGTMIMLPLRDKTLEIWTEGSDFLNDFNNTILPSLSFVP